MYTSSLRGSGVIEIPMALGDFNLSKRHAEEPPNSSVPGDPGRTFSVLLDFFAPMRRFGSSGCSLFKWSTAESSADGHYRCPMLPLPQQ